MRKLILIRHGKSSWNHPVEDLKRPLRKRGMTDVKRVSKSFKSMNIRPDFVFSSPAKRALDTCKIFLEYADISYKNMLISPVIYDFSGGKTLDFIKLLPDDYKNVMIFGHNHAFTALVNLLGSLQIVNVPTSGLVMIEFEANSWNKIEKGTTTLITFPKQLR